MSPFDERSEEEVRRINQLQRELFDKIYRLFEPPLPEGVPERLERIVAAGEIAPGDTVLDVGSGTGIMVLTWLTAYSVKAPATAIRNFLNNCVQSFRGMIFSRIQILPFVYGFCDISYNSTGICILFYALKRPHILCIRDSFIY